ncbi:fructosamine kinase family protein [Balneolales bacterium ANBcel1]|nr:fructosamine kinase family protein [Balneolales bacterium ANBcel1]
MISSDPLQTYLQKRFNSNITDQRPVGGGCINDTTRLKLSDGTTLFVKRNRHSLHDMFVKEAKGLQLLAGATSGLRVPEVVGILEDQPSDSSWLLLSFIEEGRSTGDFDQRFGRALAELHRHTADKYGLDHDNYIGRLPQKNDYREEWIRFFIECRIEPQFAMARQHGYFSGNTRSSLDQLFKALPDLIPDEPPSLLHGDLWGGNYLCDNENRPVLIDPAVYYGHREMEIAFTRMFGGFGRGFYQGYEEAWPMASGFSQRQDIYNLYPLLVHVNLFGGSYASQAESVIRRFS